MGHAAVVADQAVDPQALRDAAAAAQTAEAQLGAACASARAAVLGRQADCGQLAVQIGEVWKLTEGAVAGLQHNHHLLGQAMTLLADHYPAVNRYAIGK